jgi:membrane dipeptidase
MLPYVIDLHEDIAYYYVSLGASLGFDAEDFDVDVEGRHVDIPKFRRARVKMVFASVFPLSSTVDHERASHIAKLYQMRQPATVMTVRAAGGHALEQIKLYDNLARIHSKDLALVEAKEDVESTFRSRKTGLLMSIEGSEALEEVGDLEVFYKLGVRSLHLTWNYDNRYSASCMSKKDYGLTGEGEALVERANQLGVILDMAHASENASFELLNMTKLPAIFSHTNSRAVKDHVRNVDDEQIALLKRKGGVMGFDLISSTLGPRPSVKTVADHVMHVYEEFGSEVLALGSDFLGTTGLPKGLEDVTKVGNLWKELTRRGMKSDDIEKLAYRNALRVIKANAAKWR